jgi:hypothetical protein
MAWIESHQALGHHPKTLQLASDLGVSLPTAVGSLHFLWWWALDYAPDGLLRPGSEVTVARACHWRGKAERFWSALIRAGFVDELPDGGHIHDWMDYAGRYIDKRRRDAERKRTSRQVGSNPSGAASSGRPADVQEPSARTNQPTINQPNRTNTSPPTPPSDQPKGGDMERNGVSHSPRMCPGCGRVIPASFPSDQPYCHEPGATA